MSARKRKAARQVAYRHRSYQIGIDLAAGRDKSFVVILSPDYVKIWRQESARWRYKMERHNERFKRRYGFSFKLPIMEVGSIENFRFISSPEIPKP